MYRDQEPEFTPSAEDQPHTHQKEPEIRGKIRTGSAQFGDLDANQDEAASPRELDAAIVDIMRFHPEGSDEPVYVSDVIADLSSQGEVDPSDPSVADDVFSILNRLGFQAVRDDVSSESRTTTKGEIMTDWYNPRQIAESMGTGAVGMGAEPGMKEDHAGGGRHPYDEYADAVEEVVLEVLQGAFDRGDILRAMQGVHLALERALPSGEHEPEWAQDGYDDRDQT